MTTIAAHPDALYFLHAQGFIALAVGVALGLLLAVAGTRRTIRKSDLPWMIMGLVSTVFLVFEGIWSFTRPTDPLTVDGDRLRVGGDEVVLGADTHVSLRGREPARPDGDASGYGRLPGGDRLPPFFTGGPEIVVKSGGASLAFKPVVYGPSGYFLTNANRDADKLFARLASYGEADAKSWLAWMATPASYAADAPQPTHSMSTFYAIYIPLSVLVIGFLIGVNVLLMRDRRRKADVLEAART